MTVKVVRNDAHGQQEAHSLSIMQEALAKQDELEPCHIAQFEGDFPCYDEVSQQDNLYIVTRYSTSPHQKFAFACKCMPILLWLRLVNKQEAYLRSKHCPCFAPDHLT